MHYSHVFFRGCIAFSAGVFAAGLAAFSDRTLSALLILGTIGMVLAITSSGNKKHLAVGVGIAAVVLGAIRASAAEQQWQKKREEFMRAAYDPPKKVTAVVAGRQRTTNATVYTLEQIQLDADAYLRQPEEYAHRDAIWSLLHTGRETFRAGDRVGISGMRFDTTTTGEPFLKRDRIAGSLVFPKRITIVEHICAASWQSSRCIRYRLNDALAIVAESFEKNIHRALPEPHASLAIGLLTGARSGLPQDLKDDFRRTGLSHIVAVSGYNISIIVLAVSTLLGWFLFSRRAAFWVSAGFLLVFTLLTGASASVARAAIMGFLVILAQKESRLYSARTAIAFAGAVMLYQNPFLLRYDLGFLLSFLATGGLLALFPLLEERTHAWPKLLGLKDIVLQSVSAQLFVVPVLLIAFGSVSLIFLLANAAVLPLIPPVMLFGFLGGMAGYAGDILARLVAFPAYVLLHVQLQSIMLLGGIPYASIVINSVTLRWVLGGGAALCVAWLVWRLCRVEVIRHE